MHEHLMACDKEDCGLPRYEAPPPVVVEAEPIPEPVEVSDPPLTEGELVAQVANKALDTIAEMQRNEEETERVEAVSEAIESVAKDEAETPEPETPEVREDELEEGEPPPDGEVEKVEPPAQEMKSKEDEKSDDKSGDKHEAKHDEKPRARHRFASHRR